MLMLKAILAKLSSKNSNETQKVVSGATHKVISNAYTRKEEALNSLKQYDRGEKQINAPDIKDTLQHVRGAI